MGEHSHHVVVAVALNSPVMVMIVFGYEMMVQVAVVVGMKKLVSFESTVSKTLKTFW